MQNLKTVLVYRNQMHLKSALADIHATTYKWEIADEENHLKLETKNRLPPIIQKGNW
jgi:hypothetical protein